MSDKEHIWIPKLKQQLADKKIDRREEGDEKERFR